MYVEGIKPGYLPCWQGGPGGGEGALPRCLSLSKLDGRCGLPGCLSCTLPTPNSMPTAPTVTSSTTPHPLRLSRTGQGDFTTVHLSMLLPWLSFVATSVDSRQYSSLLHVSHLSDLVSDAPFTTKNSPKWKLENVIAHTAGTAKLTDKWVQPRSAGYLLTPRARTTSVSSSRDTERKALAYFVHVHEVRHIGFQATLAVAGAHLEQLTTVSGGESQSKEACAASVPFLLAFIVPPLVRIAISRLHLLCRHRP